jgi:Protein of unknown function (DUF3568)
VREAARRTARSAAAAALLTCLAGCQALAVTVFGAGASAGISHTLNGLATRTFAAATDQVHAATLAALRRLGMRYETITERGRLVKVEANAGNSRQVEINYQALTANATEMRVAVKTGGLLYDRATADEIIKLTAKQLAQHGG